MLELEEAISRILSAVQPLGHEIVTLRDAAGRVPAVSVISPVDLPIFDNSAMDGYGVRAADLTSASAGNPSALRLIGKVAAGEVFKGAIEAGTCVRLFTGSPMPNGADAVVMQEDARPDPARPDRLWFLDTVKTGENVRLRGEDVKRGAELVPAGNRLTAGQIALLAAAGVSEIKAARRPRVALLATGSELVESGQPLSPGKIYENKRAMAVAPMKRSGAIPES